MKLSRPADRRKPSSTPHYQTFPTPPPRSKGRPPSKSPPPSYGPANGSQQNANNPEHTESPLPTRQLFVLAIIALCEQTALNSIGPYLPQMASTFPEVGRNQVGLYVGTIASSYALAQLATVYFWGWLADRIGRKPVILLGTIFTAIGFVAFGFSRTLWQAILVQAFMGLMNGNQGVVSTCLGEITDRSNQSKAFTYLPVIYGIGGITGPIVGGLLVSSIPSGPLPFLAPNLFSAAVLFADLIITMLFLEESLEEAKDLPPLGKRVGNLFSWVWHFASSSQPTYLRSHKRNAVYSDAANDEDDDDDDDDDDDGDGDDDSESEEESHTMPTLFPEHTTTLGYREVLNRDTVLLLITYFVFQFSNVSFNSLYPVFGNAPPPTGRALSPEEIGVSLAFAGMVTIVFQVGIFGKLRDKMGNKTTYRVGLGGFVIAYFMMPFVGYKDADYDDTLSSGKVWLWIELGVALLVKTVAAVGGLTSALLLITNSASNNSVLGRLNGLAQTLSAAGRSMGPFLAGSLFTLATRVPKGEALAFGVFGGIAFIGFILSFGIRGAGLEAEGWEEEEGEDDDEDVDDEAQEGHGLMR